ncbi:MAG TPA: DUF3562 domain-containing protein [Dermatophilaceae bacterium]
MTTSPVVGPASGLAATESDLTHEFVDVPADVIHALVARECHHYDDARVRDYVPLLVARAVRLRLREHRNAIRRPSPA